jgi:hypothetical protein
MSTEPGSDPIGDFQRWLMKAGARSIGRDVAGRVKSTLGGGGAAKNDDVWDTATTEEPTDEPPECQWCPICRAARRYRDSGGAGVPLGDQLAGVGDTLAGLTRDAFSLFDSALRASQRPAPPSGSRPSSPPARQDHSDHGTVVVGPGVGWPTVVHPQHEDDEAADEGRDREEGGKPGDGGAGSGTDEQVEGTAE